MSYWILSDLIRKVWHNFTMSRIITMIAISFCKISWANSSWQSYFTVLLDFNFKNMSLFLWLIYQCNVRNQICSLVVIKIHSASFYIRSWLISPSKLKFSPVIDSSSLIPIIRSVDFSCTYRSRRKMHLSICLYEILMEGGMINLWSSFFLQKHFSDKGV